MGWGEEGDEGGEGEQLSFPVSLLGKLPYGAPGGGGRWGAGEGRGGALGRGGRVLLGAGMQKAEGAVARWVRATLPGGVVDPLACLRGVGAGAGAGAAASAPPSPTAFGSGSRGW